MTTELDATAEFTERKAHVARLESELLNLRQQHARGQKESLEHVRKACKERDEARAQNGHLSAEVNGLHDRHNKQQAILKGLIDAHKMPIKLAHSCHAETVAAFVEQLAASVGGQQKRADALMRERDEADLLYRGMADGLHKAIAQREDARRIAGEHFNKIVQLYAVLGALSKGQTDVPHSDSCEPTKKCGACKALDVVIFWRDRGNAAIAERDAARAQLLQSDREIATAIERARVAEACAALAKKEMDKARAEAQRLSDGVKLYIGREDAEHHADHVRERHHSFSQIAEDAEAAHVAARIEVDEWRADHDLRQLVEETP